jgi:hypothetical protein
LDDEGLEARAMRRYLEFFDEAAIEDLLAHDELGDGQTNREDGAVLLLALHHPALTCVMRAPPETETTQPRTFVTSSFSTVGCSDRLSCSVRTDDLIESTLGEKNEKEKWFRCKC